MPYAGSSAPSGWLLCDGSAISRTTYVDLFAVISTAFGSGDGSTTFNIPDLRGRTVAGKDNMGGTAANRITAAGSGITGTTLGAAGGAETHTLTTAQIPSHTHNVTGNTTASGTSKVSFASTNASLSTQATSSTGGDGAHNNTQPTMILNQRLHKAVVKTTKKDLRVIIKQSLDLALQGLQQIITMHHVLRTNSIKNIQLVPVLHL
jgi:microcystin-dependent protein